jgi:hypothetical protein
MNNESLGAAVPEMVRFPSQGRQGRGGGKKTPAADIDDASCRKARSGASGGNVWHYCLTDRLCRCRSAGTRPLDEDRAGGVAGRAQALAELPHSSAVSASIFRAMKLRPNRKLRRCGHVSRPIEISVFNADLRRQSVVPISNYRDVRRLTYSQAGAASFDEKVMRGHWHGAKRELKRRSLHGPCVWA